MSVYGSSGQLIDGSCRIKRDHAEGHCNLRTFGVFLYTDEDRDESTSFQLLTSMDCPKTVVMVTWTHFPVASSQSRALREGRQQRKHDHDKTFRSEDQVNFYPFLTFRSPPERTPLN